MAKRKSNNRAQHKKERLKQPDQNAAKPMEPRPLHLHLLNTTNMLAAATMPYAMQPETYKKALETVLSMTGDMMKGIEAYRTSATRPIRSQYEKIWQAGGVSLLRPFESEGEPVFIIPSLINRFHIIDLSEQHSFIRFLNENGFCPYILDWGVPDDDERMFDINMYVLERIIPALEFLNKKTQSKIHVMGYCMGGTLATAVASIKGDIIKSLVALAAPWDFHVDDKTMALRMRAFCMTAEGVMHDQGVLPVDWIQALFASIDPLFAFNKFRAFSKMQSDDEKAQRFVIVEDWLNDGVDLSAPAARQTLLQWYGDNEPASGVWTIGKHLIDVSRINVPTLVVAAGEDRLVPPKSAQSLAQQIQDAQVITPMIGHIGMMASNRAVEEVWEPVAAWLKRR